MSTVHLQEKQKQLRNPKIKRDYSPPRLVSSSIQCDSSEPLPSVVEELASMVAVSGEDLEVIARDRNKSTPELKFLFEKNGPLYKRYRARVAELQKSFEIKFFYLY